jgi:hypothetical protein
VILNCFRLILGIATSRHPQIESHSRASGFMSQFITALPAIAITGTFSTLLVSRLMFYKVNQQLQRRRVSNKRTATIIRFVLINMIQHISSVTHPSFKREMI